VTLIFVMHYIFRRLGNCVIPSDDCEIN